MMATNQNIQVEIGTIQIQYISGNSGIFVGSNLPVNWSSQLKSNSAGGTVAGDGNILYQSMNIIYDPDVVDASWVEISLGDEGDKEDKKDKEDKEGLDQDKTPS